MALNSGGGGKTRFSRRVESMSWLAIAGLATIEAGPATSTAGREVIRTDLWERVIKKPGNMSWERAAVVEPLSGAAYAIERGGVLPGDTVLIAGAGPVGLMALLGLKAIGVEKIYQTDISETRRKKAEELGATLVLNPLTEKIPAKMKELSAGRGVDVAIEAVGIEATLKDCLASVRYQGKVIVQGIFTDRIPVHMLGFVTRETTMIGTNSINPS